MAIHVVVKLANHFMTPVIARMFYKVNCWKYRQPKGTNYVPYRPILLIIELSRNLDVIYEYIYSVTKFGKD